MKKPERKAVALAAPKMKQAKRNWGGPVRAPEPREQQTKA
jgi:hypothetical protein